ncbi:hypothetical protein V6N11_055355 [Hibiscus sabdariffa]|uniref:Uncharacterized protein n=1 Tax=Hibiscus sabdariffa TaxID=183260 RepID=A0ABR2PF31_9ROSI
MCVKDYLECDDLLPRDIKYEQGSKLSRLRDKPVTQQDALSSSEVAAEITAEQDMLSRQGIPFVSLSKQIIKADA